MFADTDRYGSCQARVFEVMPEWGPRFYRESVFQAAAQMPAAGSLDNATLQWKERYVERGSLFLHGFRTGVPELSHDLRDILDTPKKA